MALLGASLGVGINVKPERLAALLASAEAGSVDWIEAHPENWMGAGGLCHALMTKARERYPLSWHGVGLSLVGEGAPDKAHLAKLRALVDRYDPALVSEHLAWSALDGVWFNDLLPAPMTHAALVATAERVDATQTALGRRILVENPSLYGRPRGEMDEPTFLTELARRTGCGLLLDVNNIHVCAVNLGFRAEAYLDAIPPDLVEEIHIAGAHEERLSEDLGGGRMLVDDHGQPPAEEVWALLARFLARVPSVLPPVLVEWDANPPPLATLLAQVARVREVVR